MWDCVAGGVDLGFLFFGSACAEGVSVGTEVFCPAGRAIFLSLNKKKQKINTGAAPLCTRLEEGQGKGPGQGQDDAGFAS